MGQLLMPVGPDLFQLTGTDRSRIRVGFHDGSALFPALFSQQEGQGLRLAGLQGQHGRQSAAAVPAVIAHIAQIAGFHAGRIPVAPVASQEGREIPAPGRGRRAGQTEETLGHAVPLPVCIDSVQISVDLLADPVLFEQGPADEEGILQIDLVLLIVAVVGEFGAAGHGQMPGRGREIGQGELPDFIGLSKRHIIQGLAADPVIFRADHSIACAVAAFALIFRQVLAHRLPGGGPVIAVPVVPDINIASGLVIAVEHIAEDPAVGAGFGEAVTARVIGNQSPVFGRSQIVGPGRRRIGPCYDIFLSAVIKITVFHLSVLTFPLTVSVLL